jgi:branched-chain amino acid transport system permease protein
MLSHRAATTAVIIGLLVAPLFVADYGYYILSIILVYAIVSLGLNILIGMGGQISIGHAGFWALGAYASALTVINGGPFIFGVLVGGAVAAMFGALVALPALRVQGHYLAIATLGFSLFIQQVLFEWESLTGGRQGLFVPRPSLFGVKIDDDFYYYYLVLAIFLILNWMAGNFARSYTGRSLMALRMSSIAAESCGIPRPKHIIIAFAISAFFTGISGALYAHLLGHLSAEAFEIGLSLSFLTMAVIGGLHSRGGALLGGAFLALVPEFLREFKEGQMMIYGIALILCVRFLPRGLIGVLEDVEVRFRKRSKVNGSS